MRRVDYIVGARDFKALRAEQFVRSVVFFHHVDDSGEKLAQTMIEGGFGSLPVVDENRKLIGIVSEFDLLEAIKAGKPLVEVKAGEIMTRSPTTVAPDTPAMDMVRVLQEKHLLRMPVVDGEGRLVGIVARRDILAGYLKATTPVKGF